MDQHARQVIEREFPKLAVQATVGQGRYSTVYRCRDKELQRDVAIKVSGLQTLSEDEQGKIKREVLLSCKVRHPNIASGLDGHIDGNVAVLVLPLCQTDLWDAVRSKDNSDWRTIVRWLLEMTNAVAYLHARNILHVDIKPQNMMLGANGRAALIDFGSCVSGNADKGRLDELVLGSPAYLAPELAAGSSTPTKASDIYGLGASLFALLTGRPPFEGDALSIIKQVQDRNFPQLTTQSLGSSGRMLNVIIQKACAADPSQRYNSAQELADDLTAVLQNRPINAVKRSRLTRVRLWASRNPFSAKVLAALVLVLTVGSIASGAGWWFARERVAVLNELESELSEKGQSAAQQEKELSSILNQVQIEQDSIDKDIAEQERLNSVANDLQQQISSETAATEEKLQEANKLAEQIRSTQAKRADAAQQLTVTSQTAEYQEYLSRRLQANAVYESLKSNTESLEALQAIVPEFHGFARMQAMWAVGANASTNRERILLPGKIEHVAWSESEHEMAVSGSFEDIVVFELTSAGALQERARVPWAIKQSSGSRLFELGGPDPSKATHLATAERLDSGDWGFRVIDLASKRVHKVHRWSNFHGEVHAMRFFAGDTVIVLRADHSNGCLEWITVDESTSHWRSDSNSVLDISGSVSSTITKAAQSLIPLFVNTGTNRHEHLCLLLASNSDPNVQQQLYLQQFLFDRASNRIQSYSLDLGQHKLSNWPASWQVSSWSILGGESLGDVDEEILARARSRDIPATWWPTSDPPRVGDIRDWCRCRYGVVAKADPNSKLTQSELDIGIHRYVSSKWIPLHQLTDANLPASGFDPQYRQHVEAKRLRSGGLGSSVEFGIAGKAQLDTVPGQVRFWTRDNAIITYDLWTEQTLWVSERLAPFTGSTLISSPSGHQLVMPIDNELRIATLGDVTTVLRPNASQVFTWIQKHFEDSGAETDVQQFQLASGKYPTINGPEIVSSGQDVSFSLVLDGKEVQGEWSVNGKTFPSSDVFQTKFDAPGVYRMTANARTDAGSVWAFREVICVLDAEDLGADAEQWDFVHENGLSCTFSPEIRHRLKGDSSTHILVSPYHGQRAKVLFPKTRSAAWSTTGKSKIIFWWKSVNTNQPGWQDHNPEIVLYKNDSEFATLVPNKNLLQELEHKRSKEGWGLIEVPLTQDETWTINGTIPDIINYLTIGFDSWGGEDLSVWIDGLMLL